MVEKTLCVLFFLCGDSLSSWSLMETDACNGLWKWTQMHHQTKLHISNLDGREKSAEGLF